MGGALRVRDAIEYVRAVDASASPTAIAERVASALDAMHGLPCMVIRPTRTRSGYELDFQAWRHVRSDGVEVWSRALRRSTSEVFLYDPVRPPVEQRNTVHRLALNDPRAARGARAAFREMGIADHVQTRVLVCEGPVLSAAFAVYWPPDEPPADEDVECLGVFAQGVRPALRAVSHLSGEHGAAFDAAFDALAAEAYVVDDRGRILYASTVGASVIDERGDEAVVAISSAIRGETCGYDVNAFEAGTTGRRWLVTRRPREHSVERRAAASAQAWALTNRQAQVLALLVDGASNKEIANATGISVRTVEIHVTAILQKANASSRVELVVRVLGAR